MSNTKQPDTGNDTNHPSPALDVTPRSVMAALHEVGSTAKVTACKPIKPPSENYLYEIDLDGSPALLRVWWKASASQADAQLALERRLNSCGLPAATVIVPEQDVGLEIDGRPAAVVQCPEGSPGPNYVPRRASETYAALAEDISRLAAMIHVSAMGLEGLDYRETTWLENLESWTLDLDFSQAGSRGRDIVATVEAAARRFRAFCDREKLPTGVVHGGPGPWSVLVDGDRITALLDLDEAHRDSLALDVAHIVEQWGVVAHDEPMRRYDPTLVRRIVRGYCGIRPLSDSEREALAMAVPLRYAIERVRIWNLVGTARMPLTWDEYLGWFALLDLTDSEEWRALIAGA
ncbi:MAG: phosphotransferase [Gammaproteobacteria bacterium]|nr:phosphotransferase [Gammaproteobacteria bacterium]